MTHLRPALIRRAWLWGPAAAAVAVLLAAGSVAAQQRAGAPPAAGASIERGRYLVNITGCHDCHSPKSKGMTPDPERLLSGRPSTHAAVDVSVSLMAPRLQMCGDAAEQDGLASRQSGTGEVAADSRQKACAIDCIGTRSSCLPRSLGDTPE